MGASVRRAPATHPVRAPNRGSFSGWPAHGRATAGTKAVNSRPASRAARNPCATAFPLPEQGSTRLHEEAVRGSCHPVGGDRNRRRVFSSRSEPDQTDPAVVPRAPFRSAHGPRTGGVREDPARGGLFLRSRAAVLRPALGAGRPGGGARPLPHLWSIPAGRRRPSVRRGREHWVGLGLSADRCPPRCASAHALAHRSLQSRYLGRVATAGRPRPLRFTWTRTNGFRLRADGTVRPLLGPLLGPVPEPLLEPVLAWPGR